ncbi:hypothetical protein TSUD_170980 [Trifolium subterraneum]|uniref:Uncharacterized protein n=1 Tax=Trifolium subterraneum TaxID=3900 RepID=A0A2Z6LNV3_TRISU|nr:hypothetical protein TSUD_170980 [Trifolium subterraneum]
MVWDLEVPEESTRGLFRLTRLDIEKLKEFVVSKQKGRNENKKLHLSNFVVSIAYAWECQHVNVVSGVSVKSQDLRDGLLK